ncbi:hypothetical protein A7A09_013325 [Paracoccus methylarcula]|uniref:Uncharacterized protein n=1 Tax=Paracoccus methylarcula TaxID=72022 RepID=A0A422QVA9_9RHOB|nr:hypothetical protein A7A09_013325 [Paracoccus methylarcula]
MGRDIDAELHFLFDEAPHKGGVGMGAEMHPIRILQCLVVDMTTSLLDLPRANRREVFMPSYGIT